MQGSQAQGQRQALLLQQAQHLGREGGKGGQGAEKAGHEQQAPGRVELRQGLEQRQTQADEIAANQVRRQRAPGQQRTLGVEP